MAHGANSKAAAEIFTDRKGCVRIAIHVKPKASKSRVLGERNGALELSVTAPPVDGAANQAVRELLARALGVHLRDVVIATGESSRAKLVDVAGITAEEARSRLGL